MNDRTPVSDLFGIADSGGDVKRIVCYNKDTLNTPYKAGITIEVTSGTAFISMYSGGNWGMILCMVNGGVRNSLCICMKTNGVWGNWTPMVTNNSINNARIFNDINQIPYTSRPTDLKSLIKALPNNSIFISSDIEDGLGGISLADVNGKLPPAGLFEIIKYRNNRNTIRVTRCSAGFEGSNYICLTRYVSSTDEIIPWEVIETIPLT